MAMGQRAAPSMPGSRPRSEMKKSADMLVPALILLLIVLAFISLALGSVKLSGTELRNGLLGQDKTAALIIFDIRLPRTLLALSVGFVLGLSGAALQGLLRNPLADPALFGAPQAAAFGAVLVLYTGAVGALSFALPIAALLGAMVSVFLVLAVAGRMAGVTTLILAGLAIASLAAALTSIVINLSSNPFAVTEIVFWLLGSFEDRSLRHLAMALPFMVIGSVLLLRSGETLRALTLGEDTAESLGINVIRERILIVIGVACALGGSVAVSGAIGFVGLIAPHLVRDFVRGDPKAVLVPAALTGAVLTLGADMVARLVPSPTELKVGALTALMGVPFFLAIIARRRGIVAAEG